LGNETEVELYTMGLIKENRSDRSALTVEKHYLWHIMQSSDVLQVLQVSTEQGLSDAEAEQRCAHFGPNIMTPKQQQSAFVRFLLQFHQPLIYILLAATVVTVLLEEYVDAIVIFAVVLVNAIIGYIQESKALAAIDALARSMTSCAQVIRNGKKQNIDARDLVLGDIVCGWCGYVTLK
jgi:cation-transporting P-type ATPase F